MENLEYQENKEAWNNDSSTDISDVLKRTLVACWGDRRLDKCESFDRVKTRSNDWKEYSEITIYPWDCSDWKTERAEIQERHNLEYDKKYEQSFSFQLPKDFLLDNPRLVIWQWKRKPKITNDDAPLLAQRIKRKGDWKYYLVFSDGYRKEIGKFIPIEDILWQWIDMKYEVRFSDNEESYVSITANYWWNEIEIYDWPLNIPHPKEGKLKWLLNKIYPKKESLELPQAYYKFWIYRDIKEKNQETSILFRKYNIKESDK